MISKRLRWAWLTVAVLAIVSRLIGLESTPLTPDEASRALGAWDVVERGVWPASAESPLLLVGQALLFALFRPSGWTARLLPALAGMGLVMLPFLWRRRIGEIGALVAAGLLLISPLTLFAAHRGYGAALAIFGSGLLVTLTFAGPEEIHRQLRIGGMALGLALSLTGGPPFYDALIAAGFAGVISRSTAHDRSHPRAKHEWGRVAVIGIGTALLIAVAGGAHWAGWAGVLDGAAAWLHAWRTPIDRSLGPTGLLLLYEPALLIIALAGLGLLIVDTDKDHRRTPLTLALGSVSLLLLTEVRPGSTTADVSLIIAPLALFGGWAADVIWGDLSRSQRRWMGVHSALAAIFWTPGLIAMAQHARGILSTNQPALILSGLIILLALQVLLVIIFLMKLPSNLVWRSTLTGVTLIFLFIQTGFGIGLNIIRADQAVEPALHTAGSRDMAHLTKMIHELAVQRQSRWDSLPIVLLDRGEPWMPALRWALRDFDNVAQAADWPQNSDALVLTAETFDAAGVVTATSWEGMRFVVTTTETLPLPRCQIRPLACTEALRWYLYRESPTGATPSYVILWRAAQTSN